MREAKRSISCLLLYMQMRLLFIMLKNLVNLSNLNKARRRRLRMIYCDRLILWSLSFQLKRHLFLCGISSLVELYWRCWNVSLLLHHIFVSHQSAKRLNGLLSVWKRSSRIVLMFRLSNRAIWLWEKLSSFSFINDWQIIDCA